MSINQAIASRQSTVARQVFGETPDFKMLTVKSYSVEEADQLVIDASNVKKAHAFVRYFKEKIAEGWRLDSFHKQLRELCYQTLNAHYARRAEAAQRHGKKTRAQAEQEFATWVVTPHSATMH